MSEITPDGIIDRVVQEIPNFFRDGIDQLVTGEGEYIRAGEPRGTVGTIGQAVARSYCRQYGANPGAAKFGNAARIENACRPYLNDLNPGDGAEIGIPFEGGQCALNYRAFGNVRYDLFTGSVGNTVSPVRDVTTEFRLGGPIGPVSFTYNTPGTNGNRQWIMNIQTSTGSQVVGSFLTPLNTDSVSNARFEGTFQLSGSQPDNCGNPPPEVTQPRPRVDPTGPSFRFNPSGEIDIDLDVDILPDGTINVDIGTGPINVDLFPPDGDGGGGGDGDGGGGSDEDPPGDVGEEDTEGAEDADEDGNASGCAGENQVLGGLQIAILTIPPGARLYAPGIHRGACYIYMGAEDKLDQDFGGSMIRDGQFFLPEKENLTCWEVQANLGYRLRVTPYYKTLEENSEPTP